MGWLWRSVTAPAGSYADGFVAASQVHRVSQAANSYLSSRPTLRRNTRWVVLLCALTHVVTAGISLAHSSSSSERSSFETQDVRSDGDLADSLIARARASAARDDEMTVALYSRAIALMTAADSRLTGALHNRGNAHHRLKAFALAAEDYIKALQIDPNHVNSYLGLGETSFSTQSFSQAYEHYSQFVLRRPADVAGYIGRGAALAKLGAHDRAIEEFETALGYEPFNVRALLNRGISLQAVKDETRALRDFDDALRLEPNDGKLHSARGNALSGLGRVNEALAAYETAIRLGHSDHVTHFNYGNALRAVRGCSEGIRSYTASLLQQATATAFYNRGTCRFDVGDFAGAVEDLTAAMDRDHNKQHAITLRGQAYRHLGRLEEALRDFDIAVALGPGSWINLANRGLVKEGLGQSVQARADFQAAHRLKPDDPWLGRKSRQ